MLLNFISSTHKIAIVRRRIECIVIICTESKFPLFFFQLINLKRYFKEHISFVQIADLYLSDKLSPSSIRRNHRNTSANALQMNSASLFVVSRNLH